MSPHIAAVAGRAASRNKKLGREDS